jgi:hypothetical protein
MRYKNMIWIIAILLLASFASATDINTYFEHAYKLESDITDYVGTDDGTPDGMSYTAGCGISGNGGYWDGTNADVNLGDLADWHFNDADGTIMCVWSNSTNNDGNDMIFDTQTPNGVQLYFSSGKTTMYLDNTVLVGQAGSAVTLNTWYHICVVDNTTHIILYENGAKVSASSSAPNDGGTGGFGVQQDLSSNRATGCYDEMYWFNSSNDYESIIATLYNSGTGTFCTGDPCTFPAGDSTPPTITFTYPNGTYEDTYNNYSGWINFTTDEAANCTVNNTDWTQITSNSSTTHAFYNSNLLSDGNYAVNATCNDNSSNFGSSVVTWKIDTANPSLITDFTDLSTIFSGNNITGWFNFSDETILYKINITIDDTIIFNDTNISLTTYNYSLNYDISSLNTGTHHTLGVYYSDGHTANALSADYDISGGLFGDIVKFNFPEGGYAKISGTSLFDKFTTERLTDRYTFTYEPSDTKKDIYEFTIESEEPIYIVNAPNTKYGQWLVMGDHWLDFYTEDEKGDSVIFEQVKSNEVKVYVSGLVNKEMIQFNSIGDLNVVHTNYTFFHANATETYTTSILETEAPIFKLNFTINSSYISNIDAVFYWNSTKYSATKTSGTDWIHFSKQITTGLLAPATNVTNTSFYWDFNISSSSDVTDTTNEINQSIWEMILSDCFTGLPSTNVLNFTFTDENTGAKVNVSGSFLFNVWNRTSILNRSFAIIHSNNSVVDSLAICMYPSFAYLGTNYEAQFTATNYDLKNYNAINSDLNSSMQTIALQMVNSSESTAITFTIVDENDQELQNYIVKVYKYNLGTDTYEFIESKTTNSDGEVLFNLDVTDKEYSLEVYDPDGILRHTEPKQEFTSTTYTIRVVLGTTPESILLKIQNNLLYNFDTDRSARNFTLSWEDPIDVITNISMIVKRVNATGETILSHLNSSADIGDFDYNFSIHDYGTFIASIYAISSDDGVRYFIESKTLDYKEAWDVFGLEALLMAFLFVGTMAFIAAAGGIIPAIILTSIGMLFAWFMGFYQLELASLIGIITVAIIIIVRVVRRR